MNPYQNFHSKPDYLNPDVTGISRLPAHTRWGAFASIDEALEGSIYSSSNIMLLNGTYRFRLYGSPEQTEPFFAEDFDDSEYTDISVPGNWETQGYGSAVYTNLVYPWENPDEECFIRPCADGSQEPNPPHIPSANPTGCYRRYFTVPDRFENRRLVLRFEGVETAYYVWLNGRCVGFAKDSKLPSEFDVTDSVRTGENLLCVQVMHFADSSYLEDQDYWYLSGIFRNVMLVSKPELCIEDYKITALPDLHHLSGEITCDVTVARRPGFADCRVHMAVYDCEGNIVGEGSGAVQPRAEYRTDTVPTANTGRISISMNSVRLWTTESPALYRAVIRLLSRDGSVLDIEACDVGFKTIEVKNGVVLLNGKRLIVYGVNRHEHCWEGGRTVSREHMIEEIRQMKRMNINSVRTCHYPDSPDWYELCDRYGILLVCECNLETHGVMGAPTHNPAWAANFLERAVRMVCNYKNHVSIYSWSLGNESGMGANHAAMYGFVREYDHTRLCQYESGAPGKNISDVRGTMYATVECILGMLCDPEDDRPIILVEYLYQICNSGGGLWKFNELIDRFPRFQGGYVWDWQDKCLVGINDRNEKYFAYGGEFGVTIPAHVDPLFMTNNGVVLPDLTWKPVAYELKEAYCPVRISYVPRESSWGTVPPLDRILVINHDPVHTTEAYRFVLRIIENGVTVRETELEMPVIGPMDRAVVTVTPEYDRSPGCRYDMNIAVHRREATFFAEADAEVGLVQLPLQAGGAVVPTAEKAGGERRLQVEFDPETGALVRMEKDGVVYFDGAVRACFDRPYTGMDTSVGWWGWNAAFAPARNLEEKLISFRTREVEGELLAEAEYAFVSNGTILVDFTYRISGSRILVDVHFDVDTAFRALPRVGIEAVIAPGFEQLTYIGHGPNESYCDRLMSAPYGRYESTVDNEHFPFCPPSENGGHEGTRYIELANAEGRRLVFRLGQAVHFDVRRNTLDDYRTARFEHELPRRDHAWLHIDAAHAPVGGDMAWSIGADRREIPSAGGYHLRFEVEAE